MRMASVGSPPAASNMRRDVRIPGPARMGTLNLDDVDLMAEYLLLLHDEPGLEDEALRAATEMTTLPFDELDKRVVALKQEEPEGQVNRRAPYNPLHAKKSPFRPDGSGKSRKIEDPALRDNGLRGKLLATAGTNTALMFVFFQALIYNFLQTGSYYAPYSENSMVGPTGETLFDLGGVNTNQIRNGQAVRLFWGMWMHSGWLHIGLNVLCQLQYMYMLEPDWGFWRTLLCFWFSGMTGNLLSSVVDPCKTTVGSSGGLFGLMGGIVPYCVEYWRSIPRPWCIVVFSIIVIAVSILTSLGSSTDTWAHLGGVCGGILFGMGTITSFDEVRDPQRQKKKNLRKNPVARWLQATLLPECKCGWREWACRLVCWSVIIIAWSVCFWLLFSNYIYVPLGSMSFSGSEDCTCCYDLLNTEERSIKTWLCAQSTYQITSKQTFMEYCAAQNA